MQRICTVSFVWLMLLAPGGPIGMASEQALEENSLAALRKAAGFFREKVARDGGYNYSYSEDLSLAVGEGRSWTWTERSVTVQPPATPAVGLVYLDAYETTGDAYYLEAAQEVAECLVKGQVRSGGWDYRIEFQPDVRSTYAYRLEPERRGQKNTTCLDDKVTQSALLLLMRLDKVLKFKNKRIHDAVDYGLGALQKAQYPNGAWPQRYKRFPDPAKFPVKKASVTNDWLRIDPEIDYKEFYTFNDNSIIDTIKVYFEAARIYDNEGYEKTARKAADFILLAQLPEPQPGWAQQYDFDMHPTWARRFEPPAISGRESQDIMLNLLYVYRETGDSKYLKPTPSATAYFRRSRLEDGRIARFYEMETNKPLYFTRHYVLTYSDSDMPTHYSFKTGDRLDKIESEYDSLLTQDPASIKPASASQHPKLTPELKDRAQTAVASLDEQGRWIHEGSLGRRQRYTGKLISSGAFVHNARTIIDYLRATGKTANQ